MERRTLFKTLAAAAVAGTLAVTPAIAQDTIKIGASADKSGGLSGGTAVTYWPAIQTWVHDVNERGGIDVGGTKMAVELIEYDDRGTNEEAIKNVQRMINVDKVDFIIPPYATGINLAVAPLIAKAGYPQIAVTAVAEEIETFAERWPNTFWTLGQSSKFVETLADVLAGLRDAGEIGNKVALVNNTEAFGIEMAGPAKPLLEAAGFELVYETAYPPSQQDFAQIIASAQNADPDIFIAFSYPADTFGLTQAAAIADLDVGAFYVGVAGAFPAYAAANGPAAEGVLVTGAVNSADPAFIAFRDRQIEVTGVAPDYWASSVQYASLEVLEQAITRAGSLDKQAVIDTIHNGTFDTVMGEWTFEGNIIQKYWTVGQWRDGVLHGVGSTGVGGEVAAVAKTGWK